MIIILHYLKPNLFTQRLQTHFQADKKLIFDDTKFGHKNQISMDKEIIQLTSL